MSFSGVSVGPVNSNEDNAYYHEGKDIFTKFADSQSKGKAPEPTMSISAMYKFLNRIGLLDETVMTALNLDELFNEFRVEYINFDQFVEMMSKFAAMKMIDMNLLMKFIIQQKNISRLSDGDAASEDSCSTISSRSDASNAYTYYPLHDPRNKCLDELSSSDDGRGNDDEARKSDEEDQLADTSLSTVATSATTGHGDAHSYDEMENEYDEGAALYHSRTQFEIPGIPLPVAPAPSKTPSAMKDS